MTVSASRLTRAAGICAALAGLIFIVVQIKHPPMDVHTVTTTDWLVRSTAKAVMAALALIGITGMYLRQRRQMRRARTRRLRGLWRRLPAHAQH